MDVNFTPTPSPLFHWQPEYQTPSHQINHLAIAPLGSPCRFFIARNLLGRTAERKKKGGRFSRPPRAIICASVLAFFHWFLSRAFYRLFLALATTDQAQRIAGIERELPD